MTAENGCIARFLLDAGADPNIRDDKFNSTVLGWAIFFGRSDLADLIRAKGGIRDGETE
jgi:ankyrin repeat protein